MHTSTHHQQEYIQDKNAMRWSTREEKNNNDETEKHFTDIWNGHFPGSRKPCPATPGTRRRLAYLHWGGVAFPLRGRSRTRDRRPTARDRIPSTGSVCPTSGGVYPAILRELS